MRIKWNEIIELGTVAAYDERHYSGAIRKKEVKDISDLDNNVVGGTKNIDEFTEKVVKIRRIRSWNDRYSIIVLDLQYGGQIWLYARSDWYFVPYKQPRIKDLNDLSELYQIARRGWYVKGGIVRSRINLISKRLLLDKEKYTCLRNVPQEETKEQLVRGRTERNGRWSGTKYYFRKSNKFNWFKEEEEEEEELAV